MQNKLHTKQPYMHTIHKLSMDLNENAVSYTILLELYASDGFGCV